MLCKCSMFASHTFNNVVIAMKVQILVLIITAKYVINPILCLNLRNQFKYKLTSKYLS